MSELDPTAMHAALAAFDAALAAVIPALQQAWDAICAIVTRAAHEIARILRQLRAAHVIPRAWRDTMMRRKMRRYALFVAGHHV